MKINKLKKLRFKPEAGFTLAELMVAALVLVTILVGLLASYVTCFELNETSRNTTLALNAAQEKMAEIRDYSFSGINDHFAINATSPDADAQPTFSVTDMTAGDSLGVIYCYVDPGFGNENNYNMLRVVISVCWRQKGGRVIGEDKDLDGAIDVDTGEDANNNNQIDSPVQIVANLTSGF